MSISQKWAQHLFPHISIWTQNEKLAVTLNNLIPFPKSLACWSRIMKIVN